MSVGAESVALSARSGSRRARSRRTAAPTPKRSARSRAARPRGGRRSTSDPVSSGTVTAPSPGSTSGDGGVVPGIPCRQIAQALVVGEDLDDGLVDLEALEHPLHRELLVPEHEGDDHAGLTGAGGA